MNIIKKVHIVGFNDDKKIYIGSDHAGFKLKEKIKAYLQKLDYKIEDKGALSQDPSDDYPDLIIPVAEAVSKTDNSNLFTLGYSNISSNTNPNLYVKPILTGDVGL